MFFNFIQNAAARTHVQRRDSKGSIYRDNNEDDSEPKDEESTADDVTAPNSDESKQTDDVSKSESEVIITINQLWDWRLKTSL